MNFQDKGNFVSECFVCFITLKKIKKILYCFTKTAHVAFIYLFF